MDFYDVITEQKTSNNRSEDYNIYPVFKYYNVKDLICKGGEMYAFWNGSMWDTDINNLIAKIDGDVLRTKDALLASNPNLKIKTSLLNNHNSRVMEEFKKYTKLSNQSEIAFNTRILFEGDQVKREDYATTRLSYNPTEGPTPTFDELFDLLYSEDELEKILWFIGALLTNSMSKIEKFMFIYGPTGTGKGTVLKLVQMLFEGYIANISLHTLTSDSEFATAQLKEVPLLIDSDSNLSKIKNDINLLKLTGHEAVTVNIKHRQTYDITFRGLLIAASNQRYKVRNIDSGITRRAVVIEPTNKKHRTQDYFRLMDRIKFEVPSIAYKAIEVFTKRGPFFLENYVNVDMVEATDHIFAFMRENAKLLGDVVTLKKASELYKIYLDDIGFETRGYKRIIKEELKRYYYHFDESKRIEGTFMYNVYSGIKYDLIFPEKRGEIKLSEEYPESKLEELMKELGLTAQESIFDQTAAEYPAQLTTQRGTPIYKWDNVETALKDIDTKLLHYVRVPLNHIVIDLDVTENGEKNLVKNLEKALTFPPTYTELSKSGRGVHMHYIYEGDVNMLESLYEEDIEIKVFTGKQALRRRLTKCNNREIARIGSGLPQKRKKGVNMYQEVEIISWDEKKMRTAVTNNLLKKYHANTKPSMDFIKHIFEEAERQGKKYDLRDLKQDILVFAASSTNQAPACITIANEINYTTIEDADQDKFQTGSAILPKEDLYFYDVEVFPNLFVVVFKKYGEKEEFTKWVNPSSEQMEQLMKKPLVGFNNRRYDNHIIYSRLLDDSNTKTYIQSQRIINEQHGAFYGAAYEISYADIYEYSSIKQGLKKWEVDLDIYHDELEFPWDKPVPEEYWPRVVEYCVNDVVATEAVFEATYNDYRARAIIAELSGLSFNAKVQDHTARFIFGSDPKPQDKFIYTDLSEQFPGYKYAYGKSEYRGEDPSEGGYVYAEPGVYKNVAVLDVASMHPRSLINLNYFGPYTKNFEDLVDTRLLIKHRKYDEAREKFDGRLAPYLKDEKSAKDLSYSLKIIINIVYGMTSAKYDNKFRHKDNADNIVAKRGALFMIDLKHAVQEQGYKVIHIKTDSIKIPEVDDKIIKFVIDFGKQYGYTFEHEVTYEAFALVNKAVYIGKHVDNGKVLYDAVGKEFAEPYVFKTLFSKEKIEDVDFAQVKQVKDAHIELDGVHVGRIAEIYCSLSGGELLRVTDDKTGAISGTKGYNWRLFSEYKGKEDIDMSYYLDTTEKAYDSIKQVGDPELVTDYDPIPF